METEDGENRRRVARTHDELGGDTSRMLVYEAYLDCLLRNNAHRDCHRTARSENALLFHAQFDPYHRAWNDLKLAMQNSKPNAWRAVLELTLVCNLNYGPYSSSAWFWRKRQDWLIFLQQRLILELPGRNMFPKSAKRGGSGSPLAPLSPKTSSTSSGI